MRPSMTGLIPYIKILNSLKITKPVKFVGIQASVAVDDFKTKMNEILRKIENKEIKSGSVPKELKKYYLDNFSDDMTEIVEEDDPDILMPDNNPDIDSQEAVAQGSPLPDFEETTEEALLKEAPVCVLQKIECKNSRIIFRLGNYPDVTLTRGFSYPTLLTAFKKIGVNDFDFIDYVVMEKLKEIGLIPVIEE